MHPSNNNSAESLNSRLANGVWGGQHIRMEVTGGGANIEFDCANGAIDEPVLLDSKGNFDLKGKYSPQHAGPIRRDEEGIQSEVRYVGHARGSELNLTVTKQDGKETVDTFTLTHGSEGRVMKCR